MDPAERSSQSCCSPSLRLRSSCHRLPRRLRFQHAHPAAADRRPLPQCRRLASPLPPQCRVGAPTRFVVLDAVKDGSLTCAPISWPGSCLAARLLRPRRPGPPAFDRRAGLRARRHLRLPALRDPPPCGHRLARPCRRAGVLTCCCSQRSWRGSPPRPPRPELGQLVRFRTRLWQRAFYVFHSRRISRCADHADEGSRAEALELEQRRAEHGLLV